MNINKTTNTIRDKQKKRLDGWNVSLPYGIAKDLGIDTVGLTPREVWDRVQKATKESPTTFYKDKAKKGEGTDVKIKDVDEEELHRMYVAEYSHEKGGYENKEVDKFIKRLKKMKESWSKEAEKMETATIRKNIDDCDKKIKELKKNPERDGENLAIAIEHKAILNSELKRRPKEK